MKATKFFSPTSLVHYVRQPDLGTAARIRGYLVLHCTGRSMRDLAVVPEDTQVTCKACTARVAREGGIPEWEPRTYHSDVLGAVTIPEDER